ncbi:MAG TPA: cytochrome b/b6 domain-containing protein [Gammaproteobacteria bacterium]
MSTTKSAAGSVRSPADRVLRHALIDRVFHWVTAAAVLTLLATAFLPIVGLQFPWVAAHWIAGFVLIASIVFHVFRALLAQSPRSMWIGGADWRDLTSIARWNLRLTSQPPRKPGKYSLAQKLIHHLFALVLIAASITGALMMVRIDTPWWERNPYWLPAPTWGVIYVVHGLAALCLVTMVIAHVYFALRPEKLLFTRAMIRGWITRDEYRSHHDEQRWQVTE